MKTGNAPRVTLSKYCRAIFRRIDGYAKRGIIWNESIDAGMNRYAPLVQLKYGNG